jgi:hypothetical protein
MNPQPIGGVEDIFDNYHTLLIIKPAELFNAKFLSPQNRNWNSP